MGEEPLHEADLRVRSLVFISQLLRTDRQLAHAAIAILYEEMNSVVV